MEKRPEWLNYSQSNLDKLSTYKQPKSKKVLYVDSNEKNNTTKSNAILDKLEEKKPYSLNTKKKMIKGIQKQLYQKGFYKNNLNSKNIDGIIGENTKKALALAEKNGYYLDNHGFLNKKESTKSQNLIDLAKKASYHIGNNSYSTEKSISDLGKVYQNMKPDDYDDKYKPTGKDYYISKNPADTSFLDNKDAAIYFYKKGKGYGSGSQVGRALFNFFINNKDTLEIKNEDMKRQYYGLYLLDKDKQLHDNDYKDMANLSVQYEKNGGLGEMFRRAKNNPIQNTFNNANKGFIKGPNGDISLYDFYDFHTDYDKINKGRIKDGKKPLSIGFNMRGLETIATRTGFKGYPITLNLTPKDIYRFNKEYLERKK